ncbi:hypothetical protein GALMADRAFT_446815 [Galerina marginata CBS 339.88]|uniref:Uncharacterized protein n=1 Tax=Galerina marginata (strain CBS 339.88) TaxID=685588 RepID=A0A067T9B2_GALM3|nr:hypothetical protein GALMADRAFT_446815 [Galerina marginata CBS 339.88]
MRVLPRLHSSRPGASSVASPSRSSDSKPSISPRPRISRSPNYESYESSQRTSRRVHSGPNQMVTDSWQGSEVEHLLSLLDLSVNLLRF